MADSDLSSYILRYNLITQGPEYFNGADYYPMSLPASDVLTAPLTGFSSTTGSVSSSDTVLSAFEKLAGNQALYLPLTGGALTGALSITGTVNAGSATSQSGVMAYLASNSSGNRQLYLKDGTIANASANVFRLLFESTALVLDVGVGDGSGSGAVPITIGNITNGMLSPGSMGVGGARSASALIAMTSTTKGFLPPTMTTTQKNAISTPPEGLVVYDTTLHGISFYNGSAWVTLTTST